MSLSAFSPKLSPQYREQCRKNFSKLGLPSNHVFFTAMAELFDELVAEFSKDLWIAAPTPLPASPQPL